MATLYHQVWINAPVSTAYAAISTATGLGQWWAPHTSTQTPDGLVLAHHPGPEHGEVRMKVIDLQPDRRVEWEIISMHPRQSPASAWTGTQVVFDLSERDNPGARLGIEHNGPRMTALDFRHAGWDEQSEYLGFCNFAWGATLMMLKQWCESR